MNTKVTMLVAGTLLSVAMAASAGNRAETFSISPIIGGISFEGKQHLETTPVYGLRVGYNFTKALGVEALFDYARVESTISNDKADFYRYGGELLYHFIPDSDFVPYIAAGYGGANFDGSIPLGSANRPKGVFDYGVGAKYFFTDSIALRGDVRHLVYRINKDTQQAVEYAVGLYFPFGGTKTVAKQVEQPPPPVEKPVVAPVPPLDSDGDGVADSMDKCPDTPKGVAVDAVGCPVDSDGDGVPDYLDKCHGTPAGVKVDSDGCPLDSDKDGVADYLDKCPETPDGVKVDPDGCPLDSDKDGVADYLDKCPDTPAGTKVDKDGCPQKLCSPTVINIQFDTNKADIKPRYHGELKKLADFLKEFPAARGSIDGYTDNVGSKASNMKLSLRRAESVRNYLVKSFGIAPERIEAKGYGPDKPIANNKTVAGKQLNRRIESNFTCNEK